VASKVSVPTTSTQVTQFGLDLGQRSSNKLDNMPENTLGQSLLTLSQLSASFTIQDTITESVDKGMILLLVDLQTSDFMTTAASSLNVKIGANPVPNACSSDADTTCRHHLDGNAMFSIAANSPTDASVTGAFSGGTFTGGPGKLTLQIALGSVEPIPLNLVNARAKATSVSATGMTAILGGLLTTEEVNAHVIPAVYAQIGPLLESDCGPEASRTPPGCGCTGAGILVVSQLDTMPKDCKVTLDEFKNNPFTQGLLQPDICSTASCTTPDALSVGVQVEAVKATFPGLN
jgi:hypothetical protein